MARVGKRAVGFALGLLAIMALPTLALAEQVECPSCWQMIDEGPCRCPHCESELPDRTCPPETRSSTQRSGSQGPSKAGRSTTERRTPPSKGPPRRPPPERREEAARQQAPRSTEDSRPGEPSGRTVAASQGFGTSTPGSPTQERDDDRDEELDDELGDEVADDLDDEFDDELDYEYDDDEIDEEEDESDDDEAATPVEPYSAGPAFLVGYRYFGLYDWTGEGHSHAFTIEGYPIRRFVPLLRVGLGLDVGFRELDRNTDWVMRGFVSIGIQYPRRVTPYASLNLGGGTVYRKRFGQGLTDGMFAVGFDIGATFGISRTFSADLSVGYLYMSFNDLGYHSPNVRVSLGW